MLGPRSRRAARRRPDRVCGIADDARRFTETTLDDWERKHTQRWRAATPRLARGLPGSSQQGRGGSLVVCRLQERLVAGANACSVLVAKAHRSTSRAVCRGSCRRDPPSTPSTRRRDRRLEHMVSGLEGRCARDVRRRGGRPGRKVYRGGRSRKSNVYPEGSRRGRSGSSRASDRPSRRNVQRAAASPPRNPGSAKEAHDPPVSHYPPCEGTSNEQAQIGVIVVAANGSGAAYGFGLRAGPR